MNQVGIEEWVMEEEVEEGKEGDISRKEVRMRCLMDHQLIVSVLFIYDGIYGRFLFGKKQFSFRKLLISFENV